MGKAAETKDINKSSLPEAADSHVIQIIEPTSHHLYLDSRKSYQPCVCAGVWHISPALHHTSRLQHVEAKSVHASHTAHRKENHKATNN
jgi:hypothetical protein